MHSRLSICISHVPILLHKFNVTDTCVSYTLWSDCLTDISILLTLPRTWIIKSVLLWCLEVFSVFSPCKLASVIITFLSSQCVFTDFYLNHLSLNSSGNIFNKISLFSLLLIFLPLGTSFYFSRLIFNIIPGWRRWLQRAFMSVVSNSDLMIWSLKHMCYSLDVLSVKYLLYLLVFTILCKFWFDYLYVALSSNSLEAYFISCHYLCKSSYQSHYVLIVETCLLVH